MRHVIGALIGAGILLVTGCVKTGGAPAGSSKQPSAPTTVQTPTQKPVLAARQAVEVKDAIVTSEDFLSAARPAGKGVVYVRQARGGPYDLMYVDLTTKHEHVVATTKTANGQVDMPASDGTWVVWLDWSQASGEWTLFGQKFSDQQSIVVASSKQSGVPSFQAPPEPAISQGRAVWVQEEENFKTNLYTFDLQTKKIQRLTQTGDLIGADIAGDTVVYERRESQEVGATLWLLDLAKGNTRQLTYGNAGYFNLAEGWVAYDEVEVTNEGAMMTLIALNLKTGEVRQIAPKTNPGYSYFLTASGGYVAWQTSGDDIHVTPLDKAEPTLNISVPSIEKEGYTRHPWVVGKQVVWLGVDHIGAGTSQEMVYYLELP